MATAKVTVNGNTIVDLTDATATADKILSPYTAYGADGSKLVGTASGGGSDTWSWMGRNPVKLQTWEQQDTFRDLGFDQWTYSTSQSAIRNSANLSPTIQIDITEYDYVILTRTHTHYVYSGEASGSALVEHSLCGASTIYGTCNDYTSNASGVPNSTANNSLIATNGAYTRLNSYIGSNYGVYSSTASDTTCSGSIAIVAIPIVYARGNSTYFSETMFSLVDMDNSYYKYCIEAWRVDRETGPKAPVFKMKRDILNTGL